LDLTLFAKSAEYYDLIYDAVGKNYEREASRIRRLVQLYERSSGNTLLDVACGTGRHLRFLKRYFKAEGLDLDPNLLKIARNRNPDLLFHRGNMLTFNLHKQFDVITCLFSAIGYMKTVPELRRAIRNMGRHLKAGGVLIVEPWLTPTRYQLGRIDAVLVKQPKLKIVRMNRTIAKGNLSMLDFHYLIGTPQGITHFKEVDEFGLFTYKQYVKSFHAAGLKVHYDSRGLVRRGLFSGTKPLNSWRNSIDGVYSPKGLATGIHRGILN
jgi:SAM-dependent methyltransferase